MKRKIVDLCAALGVAIPEGMHPCAFADREASRGVGWAADLYARTARDIGDVWGSNLNGCPEFTHLSYMGSFLANAMRIDAFRDTVRAAMMARSMFPERDVTLAETSAPRHDNGQSLGPLYGAARIWTERA